MDSTADSFYKSWQHTTRTFGLSDHKHYWCGLQWEIFCWRGYFKKVCLLPVIPHVVTPARIPYCFLIIGGVIAVLSLLGLSLISESDQETQKQAEKLPSLSPMEVVKTRLFYQVSVDCRISPIYVESHAHMYVYYCQIYCGFLAVCGSQVHSMES